MVFRDVQGCRFRVPSGFAGVLGFRVVGLRVSGLGLGL